MPALLRRLALIEQIQAGFGAVHAPKPNWSPTDQATQHNLDVYGLYGQKLTSSLSERALPKIEKKFLPTQNAEEPIYLTSAHQPIDRVIPPKAEQRKFEKEGTMGVTL